VSANQVTDPASVVRRYYEVVADLGSSREDLLALLHPDVRIVEHPNPISPRGAVRDRDATVEGFLAGKRLLSEQSFDVHEVLVSGDRVAVRATWRGTVGEGRGGLAAGSEIVAQVAGLLTVTDGLIRDHETFDCYEPFGAQTA
jgi:ketosteroid isomerase-like protein